jgi:prepilin-type processing-associated H-X9-DG protein
MRELLLAYLFGQLDGVQRERVERALADEPRLQEELRRLRLCLGVDEPEVIEPPPDLVERTCSRVISLARAGSAAEGRRETCAASAAEWQAPAAGGRYSPGDLAVSLGLTLVAAMLVFPALHDSRVMARRTACQNNMQGVYWAISSFAEANGGLIPHVPAKGRESFAGIFAVILRDREFVDPGELPQLLICPGTIRVGDWKRAALVLGPIPTRAELLEWDEARLAEFRPRLGGDYAYRMGFVDDDGYHPWRLDRSRNSAILADTPSLNRESFQSSNHGGRGQNVLFADGHVAFVCDCPQLPGGDKLFTNRDGYLAAGLGPLDSVLAASGQGPALQLIYSLFDRGRKPR